LSPERLITQFDDDVDGGVGERQLLDRALQELDVVRARLCAALARARSSISSVMSDTDRLAGLVDPAGGDEHVRTGSRPEVEHGLALMEVSDSGWGPRTRARR